MSSIDQQFVEFIVKSLVGHPDAVKIERRIDEKGVLLELTVDPEDLGRVIGKRGATAQSLRTLLRALGTKNDARYNLKIVDNGPYDDSRGETRQAPLDKDNNNGNVPTSSSTADPKASNTPMTAQDDDAEDELSPETSTSDVVSKARKELADLDDLDI